MFDHAVLPLLPDPDADAARASVGTRRAAFFADIKAAREEGFDVTQDYVAKVAKEYGIEAPTLRLAPAAVPAAPALRSVDAAAE